MKTYLKASMIKIWLKHLIFDQAIKSVFDPMLKSFRSPRPKQISNWESILTECDHTGCTPRSITTTSRKYSYISNIQYSGNSNICAVFALDIVNLVTGERIRKSSSQTLSIVDVTTIVDIEF